MTLQPRPTLGPAQSYRFPSLTTLQVGNGTVRAIDLPGQPYAALRLVQPSGAVAEPTGRLGAASLTAESLEDGVAGNSSLPPQLERFGAEWYANVTWDSMITGLDAPVKRLESVTSLFAEALRTPALRDSDILRRREQLVERFTLEVSMPNVLAGRAMGRRLFQGRYADPLGGTPAALAELTPDAVREFHTRSVAAAAGTLIVVGDLADVDLQAIGKAVFGDAEPATVPEPRPVPASDSPAPSVLVIDRPDSVQSALVVGQRVAGRAEIDLPSAEGMSDVLGGMFTSRLNNELRERRGCTYGVHSGYDLRRDAGVFQVRSQVDGPTTAASLATIVSEVSWLRAQGVTEAELSTVRESNTVGLPVTYATPGALAGAVVTMVVHQLPEDYVDQQRAGFEALTEESLNTAARELLHPTDMVAVIAGDAEQIAGPLRDIGFGPVEVRQPEELWSD